MLRRWEDLPTLMQNEEVKQYYKVLDKKKKSLFLKRVFDLIISVLLLILLLPIFLLISVAIKIDSPGPIMFRQVRVTQYGELFKIYKFRTMVDNAENYGSQLTKKKDSRITRVGNVIRNVRLDEIPQLFNIIKGEMTFVGTRPEVPKYVEKYTEEMLATLLLPAGVTSEASIEYRDEDTLLSNTDNVDKTYITEILPDKMKYNLRNIMEFSFFGELKIIFKTIDAVLVSK